MVDQPRARWSWKPANIEARSRWLDERPAIVAPVLIGFPLALAAGVAIAAGGAGLALAALIAGLSLAAGVVVGIVIETKRRDSSAGALPRQSENTWRDKVNWRLMVLVVFGILVLSILTSIVG